VLAPKTPAKSRLIKNTCNVFYEVKIIGDRVQSLFSRRHRPRTSRISS
jgi:hypothetical protein